MYFNIWVSTSIEINMLKAWLMQPHDAIVFLPIQNTITVAPLAFHFGSLVVKAPHSVALVSCTKKTQLCPDFGDDFHQICVKSAADHYPAHIF